MFAKIYTRNIKYIFLQCCISYMLSVTFLRWKINNETDITCKYEQNIMKKTYSDSFKKENSY